MDVIIVCHTEFGFVQNRRIVFDNKTEKGVTEGVQKLLEIAKPYGAKITFAVMPEVSEHMPQNLGQEIGLHVHPTGHSLYLSDYSFEEQALMIRKGKEKLQEVLGVLPKVFVAGRWAFNNDTAKALIESGFTHDCSALPKSRASTFWKRLPRIIMPYHLDSNDYQAKGSSLLLMVPVSQGLFGASANPEDARTFGLSWLKGCFEEYYSRKAPLFHIALHSPAMTDPFYISVMDSLLSSIASHENIRFKFVSEISEYPNQKISSNIWAYIKALI